nr:MAG TPA: protein of unknown function (DUF883) [Caudoviricetes sp.]
MSIDKTKLDELIEKMKAEAKELGLDIEEKLDEAKDKWAETATTDPDTARRQLRAFWGIVGTVAGVLIGLGVGYLVWGL